MLGKCRKTSEKILVSVSKEMGMFEPRKWPKFNQLRKISLYFQSLQHNLYFCVTVGHSDVTTSN